MYGKSLPLLALLTLSVTACDDDRMMGGDADLPDVDGGVPGGDAGPGRDGGPGSDAGMTRPTSPLVDPGCVDGMFSETLPASSADISDLVAGYSSADPTAFIEAALGRRYPAGQEMVAEGRMGSLDCAMVFLGDVSTAQAVIRQMGTVVHECGHFYDNQLSSGATNRYYINDAPLILECDQGDTTARGGLTFARSRIRNDSYSSGRMPCGGSPGDCDFYADIYLDGNPDDGTFEGGDQGFNMLFEELVQYVNSLATGLAFTSELDTGGSVSERDGLLTFLWYLGRYLHMARLDFPSAYAHLLTGDGGCWRRAILTVWGRAWLYVEATMGMDHLGIDDAELMGLATTPELLDEIQLLRDAEGCPGE